MTQQQSHEHKHNPVALPQNLEQRLAKLQDVLAQIDSEFKGIKVIEEAEELYEKLHHAIREQARGADMLHAHRALIIFHESYNVHKVKHGSYKHFIGSGEYGKLMAERYLFCYEQALKHLGKHI